MYVALLKSTLAGKVFAVDVAFVGKESQAPPSTARERRSSGGAKSGCVPHAAPLALDPSDQPSAVTDEMLPAVADGGGGRKVPFPRWDGRPEGKGPNHPWVRLAPPGPCPLASAL